MTYSLRRPPAGLTGFLRLIWPLVFVQLVALKAWVRKHYGPGVPYWYTVSRWGRVSLLHMPMDFAQSYAAPGSLRPVNISVQFFGVTPRLMLALAPEVSTPVAPAREVHTTSVHVLSETARYDSS